MMFSDSRRSFFVEDIFIDEQSKALACMSGCEAILLWIWLITAKSNAESPVFSRYCRSDASKGANGYINGSSTHSESVSGIVRNTDKKNAARSRTSSSLSYRQRWTTRPQWQIVTSTWKAWFLIKIDQSRHWQSLHFLKLEKNRPSIAWWSRYPRSWPIFR